MAKMKNKFNLGQGASSTIDITCQDCGKDCSIFEVVSVSQEEENLWCYCSECEMETFKDMEEGGAEYGDDPTMYGYDGDGH